jgi:hypothetical protein
LAIETEPDHKSLEAAAAIKEAFAFLERRGFRLARTDRDDRRSLDSVVYESAQAYVVLRFDEYRCFFIHVGELPESARGQPVESHLLRGSDRSRHISLDAFCFQPKTAEETRRAATRAAELFMRYGGDVIGPGRLDIAALRAAQDRMRDDAVRRQVDDRRRRAAAAFEAENWLEAYRLYRGIRSSLTPEEIGQFEVARRRTPPPLVRHGEDEHEWWLSKARLVDASRLKVRETAARREESEQAGLHWEDAVQSFHDALDFMYPFEFLEMVRTLADGNRDQIDQAITFLEADPVANRSGRIKGDIVRRLSLAPLEPEQEARLRTVILRAVDAGDRREFKHHYRLARRLNNVDLRQGLIERLASGNSGIRRRALWMIDRLRLELTVDSRRFAHRVIIDAGFDQDWWRAARWIHEPLRRYDDEDLRERLLAAFRGNDPPASDAALRILSLLRKPGFSPEEFPRLRARVLRAVDEDDFQSFGSLAQTRGMHSQDLVDQLTERTQGADREIARRARWALNSLALSR